MSWFSRSIADSLRIDDDENKATPNPNHSQSEFEEEEEEEEEDQVGRGVREDISEFTETLTRQLWGVASFLAPPPPPPPPLPPPRQCIRHRWEVSDQSGADVDSEEDTIGGAVGVSEEVLAFAMNIAHHPETWLDFPLEEEDDVDGFDMSDAQHEHVLEIQRLTPTLSALRIELCPAHMNEGYFWKVYFVLLHSRLNKQDAELLSTPQVVAARAMWMQELQKRTKKETYWYGRGTLDVKESTNPWQETFDHALSNNASEITSLGRFGFEPATSSVPPEVETQKHPVVSTGMQIVDKSVIEEEPMVKTKDKYLVAGPSFKVPVQEYEDDDDDDDWLKEDSEFDGYSATAVVIGNDEDVSFSDLEEDEDCTMPVKSKIVTLGSDTSMKTSRG